VNDGKTNKAKVQGYKGNTADKNDYELQIPMGSALITFKVDDCTDNQILEIANTTPFQGS